MPDIYYIAKNNITRKIKHFAKTEPVLVIASFTSIISMFIIPPDREYLGYIDFKVLACLFCLMAVVAGLRKTGLLDRSASAMTRYTVSIRRMSLILILSTFFISMAITNDVALITFVPLSIILMKNLTNSKTRIKVITLQTIAANIGSSLTPIGNPQNLYLFSFYKLSANQFFHAIGIIVLAGGLLLIAGIFTIKDEPIPFYPVCHGCISCYRLSTYYADNGFSDVHRRPVVIQKNRLFASVYFCRFFYIYRKSAKNGNHQYVYHIIAWNEYRDRQCFSQSVHQ